MLRERLRHDAVTEPPARHRVRLREAVEEDRPLAHPGEPGDRDELALVKELAVDLVREHGDPARGGERGNALELAPVEHASGRILGGVDDDEARALRHAPLEQVEVEAEAARLEQRDGDGHAADEVDDRLVDRESGVRVDDLVPLADERQDREEHDRLRAGRHDDLVG